MTWCRSNPATSSTRSSSTAERFLGTVSRCRSSHGCRTSDPGGRGRGRTTVMLRSRRLALVAIVTVLGLSACGDTPSTTSPAGAPPVIVLGSGGKVASAEASPNDGADRSMMIANIDYVFDGTYPDLGTSAPSWTLPPGAKPDAAA